jgi:formate dehydrogenase subunit delta
MDIMNLVSMANDIGSFFDAEMGPREAPAGIARHISLFWDPRMRSQIIAYAASGGEGLLPSALAAVKGLPAPAPRG